MNEKHNLPMIQIPFRPVAALTGWIPDQCEVPGCGEAPYALCVLLGRPRPTDEIEEFWMALCKEHERQHDQVMIALLGRNKRKQPTTKGRN